MNNTVYDFSSITLSGKNETLDIYRGKVLLIVNVASKCGFTNQYKELEELYRSFKDQGLVVLGFPCNQFGSQEPGNSEEIKNFCSLNYDVSFPMYQKIEVNGEHTHPLYQFLKETVPGLLGSKSIKWNFTKFLINKSGFPVARFAPTDKPLSLIPEIKKLL